MGKTVCHVLVWHRPALQRLQEDVEQACTTYGLGKRFLRLARAFSIVENAAKAPPRISNCRSSLSSTLQRNLYIEMK